MHTVCLGTLMVVQGNACWGIFKELKGAITNYKPACAKMFSMFSMMAKDLNETLPFRELPVNLFRSSGAKPPKLRLKAANGRHFLPVLIAVLEQMMPCENQHAKLRLACLKALQSCYLEFRQWGAESPRNLAKYVRQFLLLYGELSASSTCPGVLWKVYPKFHLMMHCADCTSNPMRTWNYSDEDEIGKAAAFAAGCNQRHVETALIDKYRVVFKMKELRPRL